MQNNYQTNDNTQMNKQYANSVLVGSDMIQGGYQTQLNSHMQKDVYNSSPNENGVAPSLASSKQDLSPNRNQPDSSSPTVGVSQRGKVKLKVMSQTNSPNQKFENIQPEAMGGFNQ